MRDRKRLLFVAEDVTLAQVVRLVTLARALDSKAYEIHFACARFPDFVFADTAFVPHVIDTLSPEAASRALQAGRRLYETSTLLRYIEAETRLIEQVRPDLVVGDFRLSLSTSAELMGVPSAALINAYWSPFARRESFPVPDHPIVRWFGEELTERYFPRALPSVFKHFASPVNAARKRHGLAEVGSLLEVLTHADYTLYPDDPVLTPVEGAPASHVFLGPVTWQPEAPELPLDALWPAEARTRPLIYATLGSSGDTGVLPVVLEALEQLPVRAVVATAGRSEPERVPPNVRIVDFARGADLARQARVVITNGGSASGYQALQEGTPVLGLPSNLDQYLATQAIVAAGAGLMVRARQATVHALAAALDRMLSDERMREVARAIAQRFRERDARTLFDAWVTSALASARSSDAGAQRQK